MSPSFLASPDRHRQRTLVASRVPRRITLGSRNFGRNSILGAGWFASTACTESPSHSPRLSSGGGRTHRATCFDDLRAAPSAVGRGRRFSTRAGPVVISVGSRFRPHYADHDRMRPRDSKFDSARANRVRSREGGVGTGGRQGSNLSGAYNRERAHGLGITGSIRLIASRTFTSPSLPCGPSVRDR